MRMWLLTLCALALTANLCVAAGQPSADRGKELFNNTSLGTNGKSCASCHSRGAGLDDASAYDTEKLKMITNQCIIKSLEGSPLPLGSPDLVSLVMYLKSLATTAAQ